MVLGAAVEGALLPAGPPPQAGPAGVPELLSDPGKGPQWEPYQAAILQKVADMRVRNSRAAWVPLATRGNHSGTISFLS